MKYRGGTRPNGPPTIFPGVPSSCFNQTLAEPRTTKVASAEAREEQQKKNEDKNDKIGSFSEFVKGARKRYKKMNVVHNENDLTISVSDKLGRKVLQFLHFKHVKSFEFLF